MSCGCHKESGSHRDSSGCKRSCKCDCSTHSSCPRPKRREGTCSATVVLTACDLRHLCCRCHKRRCRCHRVKEIDVGAITVCCTPVHFESKNEVETIASCGLGQPAVLVPTPLPFPGFVPSAAGQMNFFTTNVPVCNRCGH